MNAIVIAPATVAPITVRPADGVPVKVTPVAVPAIQIGGVPGIPGASGISVLNVEATQDADGTVTLRFTMSDGTQHAVRFQAGTGAPSPGSMEVAGYAEAIVTATASIRAWLDLAATVEASCTSTGRPLSFLDVSGLTEAQTTSAGRPLVDLHVAGRADARDEATASALLVLRVAGHAAAIASSSGAASVDTDMTVRAQVVAVSASTGAVGISLQVTGASIALVSTSGSAITQLVVAGNAVGVSSSTGTATLTPPSGYDADAQAYFNAMTVQPSDTRKGQIDTLVKGLKADGIWTKLDWLCLLAAHDAQAGRLNARNPAKALAALNAPSFTADRGLKGDGSTSHLSFGEAFNASGNVYALNSAHLGVWCNLQGLASGEKPIIGSSQSTRSFILPNTAGAGSARMNDSSSMNLGAAESMLGGRVLTRTAANARGYYRDGTLAQSDTAASTVVATGPAYALRNGNAYADDRLSVVSTGSGLTASEVQALHNRITTYLNAIGAA